MKKLYELYLSKTKGFKTSLKIFFGFLIALIIFTLISFTIRIPYINFNF